MRILFTADLHFTDNPRDEYRWGLLPWLRKQAQKHAVDMIILGGDITDAKDKHPATLVNRLVDGLADLGSVAPIWILRGNHDYIDENEPFFGFIKRLKYVQFVTKPTELYDAILLLPHTRNWQEEWAGYNWQDYEYIFTHATFDGCESESGFKMEGIPPATFKGASKVWSGDIHKPQQVGKNIEYVGSPYRIRFGDVFEPRVVLLDDDKATDLHFNTTSKHVLDFKDPKGPGAAARELGHAKETGGVDICEGDQVKVRVHLPRTAYADWPAIKEAITEEAKVQKLQLFGPELVPMEEPKKKASKRREASEDSRSPIQLLRAYAEQKEAPDDLADAGEGYLKQALNGR